MFINVLISAALIRLPGYGRHRPFEKKKLYFWYILIYMGLYILVLG
jgi:hypothetical protein